METCYVESHRVTAELVRTAFEAELCTIQIYTNNSENSSRFHTCGPEERLTPLLEEIENRLGYSLERAPVSPVPNNMERHDRDPYVMAIRCEECLLGHMILLGADGTRLQSRHYSELLEHHLRAIVAMERALEHHRLREEEFHMRQREAAHRMKNSLQSVSGLLSLQDREVGDPRLSAHLKEAAGRVRSVQLLYDHLAKEGCSGELSPASYFGRLLGAVLESFAPDPPVNLKLDIDDAPLDSAILSTLGLVVNELASNAVTHAFDGVTERVVTCVMRRSAGRFHVVFRDNGRGLPDGFDPGDDETTGLGTTIIRFLVERLDGSVEYRVDGGTVVEIDLPLP